MAKRTAPRINSFTFYKHRFRKALRQQRTTGDPVASFSKLKKHQKTASLSLAQNVLYFLLAALAAMASFELGTLQIRTSLVSFDVPAPYLVFAASCLWVGICFSIQTVGQFILIISAFKEHFGRYSVDYEMLTFQEDVAIDDFLAPPLHDSFLKPSMFGFLLRLFLFASTIFAFLLPAFGAWLILVMNAVRITLEPSQVILEDPLMIAALALFVFPTIFLLTAFIPFRTSRQTQLIRWIFLTRATGKLQYLAHPRANAWLDEDERK